MILDFNPSAVGEPMSEQYGRSPLVDAIPYLRERNRRDTEDLQLMDNPDPTIAKAAIERFFGRRRGVWRLMDLVP